MGTPGDRKVCINLTVEILTQYTIFSQTKKYTESQKHKNIDYFLNQIVLIVQGKFHFQLYQATILDSILEDVTSPDKNDKKLPNDIKEYLIF